MIKVISENLEVQEVVTSAPEMNKASDLGTDPNVTEGQTDAQGKTLFSSSDLNQYASDSSDHNDDDHKEIDYTDPKYQKVIDYLKDNGYDGAKFLGKLGFYIPQPTVYASLLMDDIFSQCFISTSSSKLTAATAAEYQAELSKLIPLVDDINAILSGATDASTKDRHISESADQSGIIESGNQNFGKPGTYILYRNGSRQTQRGFISFSDTKAGADKYSKDGSPTEKFIVSIKNPFISKADSSFSAFSQAYYQLTGKDVNISSDTKINDAWRDYDKEMSKVLADKEYDSLIYLVPQGNEVNVLGADIDAMPNINDYNESVPQAVGN